MEKEQLYFWEFQMQGEEKEYTELTREEWINKFYELFGRECKGEIFKYYLEDWWNDRTVKGFQTESPFKIFVTITAGILDFKYTVAKDADRVVREKILGWYAGQMISEW